MFANFIFDDDDYDDDCDYDDNNIGDRHWKQFHDNWGCGFLHMSQIIFI